MGTADWGVMRSVGFGGMGIGVWEVRGLLISELWGLIIEQ
jgi:hypothetical protein